MTFKKDDKVIVTAAGSSYKNAQGKVLRVVESLETIEVSVLFVGRDGKLVERAVMFDVEEIQVLH